MGPTGDAGAHIFCSVHVTDLHKIFYTNQYLCRCTVPENGNCIPERDLTIATYIYTTLADDEAPTLHNYCLALRHLAMIGYWL